MNENRIRESIGKKLEEFFGVEILIRGKKRINIYSTLERRLKKIAKHDMMRLMNIAQSILNDDTISGEKVLFFELIEEIIHKFIGENILDIDIIEQKYFFDQLKRISGETYESEKANLNILLFNKKEDIEKDLDDLGLDLIKGGGERVEDLFNSKLTLKLLDGKNTILILDNKLNFIGIGRNKNKGLPIKLKISERIREVDNSLLRYFFFLYINSLLKDSESIKQDLEELNWEIDEEDLREALELSEELLVADIRDTYKEYRKLTGDYLFIEIDNGLLNVYLNNSLDNYLSYNNSKWKYKSFYLFKFLIIEKLYSQRLIEHKNSNLESHEYMKKVIDNINVLTRLLKHYTTGRKGALIVILKEDLENFENKIGMKRVEEKLKNSIILSEFSYNKDFYKKIVLHSEKTAKLTEIHFNFLDLITSVDGAIILDSSFNLLTFGELIKLDRGSRDLGARTNAALSASKSAIAIKVSEDGEITMYSNKEVVIKL